MRRFLVTLAILSVLSFSIAGIALAADPHTGGTTGQPSMTCEDQSSNPGGTVAQTNAGAPFDNSTGVSGNVYANGPDN